MSVVADAAPAARVDAPPWTRMGMAVLALAGLLISSYLLLHRLGFVGTLACGAGGCDTVQASPWAVFLGVPVPAWGVGGYAAILAAALLGLQPRWLAARWVAGALFALAAVAFAFSAYLTALEAFVIRAWCRWCLGSAAISTALFALALAELPRIRGAEGRR